MKETPGEGKRDEGREDGRKDRRSRKEREEEKVGKEGHLHWCEVMPTVGPKQQGLDSTLTFCCCRYGTESS